jgi:hypothetical protein
MTIIISSISSFLKNIKGHGDAYLRDPLPLNKKSRELAGRPARGLRFFYGLATACPTPSQPWTDRPRVAIAAKIKYTTVQMALRSHDFCSVDNIPTLPRFEGDVKQKDAVLWE